MKANFKLLISLFLIISVIGCSSQDKKNASNDTASASPAMPENFERAAVPIMITNELDKANYLATHFWSKFNFRDTMYIHTPAITERAFADFLFFLQSASPEKVSEGIKKLLDNAESEVIMYDYFFKLAEKYLYDPNSEYRNDEHFIPFLEHIINNDKLMDVYKVRPRHQLELANKNRIGTKALDFAYTLASGNSNRLYNVQAKNLLLMFYNPDCYECQEITRALKNNAAITTAISSGNLKVLAVFPDENLFVWKKYIDNIPSTWINGYDKALSVKNNEIYDLKAIPTLYLLDKDKKVILKDTYIDRIVLYLQNIQ